LLSRKGLYVPREGERTCRSRARRKKNWVADLKESLAGGWSTQKKCILTQREKGGKRGIAPGWGCGGGIPIPRTGEKRYEALIRPTSKEGEKRREKSRSLREPKFGRRAVAGNRFQREKGKGGERGGTLFSPSHFQEKKKKKRGSSQSSVGAGETFFFYQRGKRRTAAGTVGEGFTPLKREGGRRITHSGLIVRGLGCGGEGRRGVFLVRLCAFLRGGGKKKKIAATPTEHGWGRSTAIFLGERKGEIPLNKKEGGREALRVLWSVAPTSYPSLKESYEGLT